MNRSRCDFSLGGGGFRAGIVAPMASRLDLRNIHTHGISTDRICPARRLGRRLAQNDGLSEKTLRTQIWLWKRQAEARYCITLFRRFLVEFKLSVLGLLIRFLKSREQRSSVEVALFTHASRPQALEKNPSAGDPE